MVRLEKGSFTYWIFPPPPLSFCSFLRRVLWVWPGARSGRGCARARVCVCEQACDEPGVTGLVRAAKVLSWCEPEISISSFTALPGSGCGERPHRVRYVGSRAHPHGVWAPRTGGRALAAARGCEAEGRRWQGVGGLSASALGAGALLRGRTGQFPPTLPRARGPHR